ncbi:MULTISPECIES: hypothetical protein [Streptomyces]|uniref:hypothetical protein n=1 Tax=Streptomyces TaxID=1883 RepID=UPI00030DCE79|nr:MULTISPECIES: hypothetical protein [Streptomyces]
MTARNWSRTVLRQEGVVRSGVARRTVRALGQRPTVEVEQAQQVSQRLDEESSPMSLGATGEALSDFETWLGSPRAE